MVEGGDAVVGLIERSRLSGALTSIHRSGQGHNARVLDAARGDVKGQLRRAGVAEEIDLGQPGADSVVILIHAPGRTAKTVELLRGTGARAIQVVSRAGAETPRPFVAAAVAKTRNRAAPSADAASD